jgi:hypothetical protein
MKYTSAEANKLIKKIEERISRLEIAENKGSTFNAAAGEDAEALRPEYDFAKTQAQLEELEAMMRKVKHAINCFNTTHSLPGFDDITVDQALVLIPQLRARKMTLGTMVSRLPRERVEVGIRSSNIIDYVITNYDMAEVERKYNEIVDRLSSLQVALDTLNTTETMEIDVKLD